MRRPEVCVGAVAVEAEQLLLIRRATDPGAGKWSLPGGRVEMGETLAEALVREVHEETGLEAVCDELVGWVERIGEDYHFVIFDFAITVLGRQPPCAGDDAAEAAWVTLAEVGDVELVDGLAEFLHDHGIVKLIA